MVDEPDSLVLRYLRRIDESVGQLRDDMREVKTRLNSVEVAVVNVASVEMSHYAATADRLDRLTAPVERMERRLDLQEA
jgi:hypothetical protein